MYENIDWLPLFFFGWVASAKVIAAAVPALEFATATRCGTAACALGCRRGGCGCRGGSGVHDWVLRERVENTIYIYEYSYQFWRFFLFMLVLQ